MRALKKSPLTTLGLLFCSSLALYDYIIYHQAQVNFAREIGLLRPSFKKLKILCTTAKLCVSLSYLGTNYERFFSSNNTAQESLPKSYSIHPF